MQAETVSKVKGWVALACLLIWIIGSALAVWGVRVQFFWDWSGVAGIICIPVGISWLRQRKRMRYLEYQGRMIHHG